VISPQANAVAMAKAAQESSLRVTGQETLAQGTPAQGTTDFVPVLEKLQGRRARPGGDHSWVRSRLASSKPMRRQAGRLH